MQPPSHPRAPLALSRRSACVGLLLAPSPPTGFVMVQRVGPGGWKHAPTRGVSSLALSCVPTLPRLVASAGRAAPVQGPADAERRRVDVPSAVRLDSQRRLHLAVIFGALGKCCHGSLCVTSARSVSITPNGICDGCQCTRWCLLFRIMMVFKREENSPRRPAAPARARVRSCRPPRRCSNRSRPSS